MTLYFGTDRNVSIADFMENVSITKSCYWIISLICIVSDLCQKLTYLNFGKIPTAALSCVCVCVDHFAFDNETLVSYWHWNVKISNNKQLQL